MEHYHALRWHAQEYEHIERAPDWYWALGVVALCLALVSVLFSDYLFAIIIIIAAFTFALMSRTAPPVVEIILTERGIRIGHAMLKYEDIIAFWVEDHDITQPIILIDTIKLMSPNIIIPIKENIDPHQVRTFLAAHIEQRPMKEPIHHKILEFFGL